jgi:phage tail-like protein
MSIQNILFSKLAGWPRILMDHMELVDGGASLRLRLLPGAARPLSDVDGTFGGFSNPAGLAVDCQGLIYIADSGDNVIKRFDPCLQSFQVLPCIGGEGNEPQQLSGPRGIAISGRNDLYVADTGNWRVQVFSIKGLALRKILGPFVVDRSSGKVELQCAPLTRGVPSTGVACDASSFTPPQGIWKPSDVAVSCTGWLYVADYNNGLIHVFDPHLFWRGAYDGASANSSAVHRPVRIALDSKCRIFVVQEGADHVMVLGEDGKFISDLSAPEDAKGSFCPIAVAVDEQDNLHIIDQCTLSILQFQETSSNDFCCVSKSAPAPAMITDLVFDRQGNSIVAGDSTIMQMPARAIYEPEGTFISDALDSRIYRCPWHSVLMHAAIAVGTQISVETLTAEDTKTAPEMLGLADERWTPSAVNSTVAQGEWDCLVQSLPGRYLWLRLKFHSDGKFTPCVDRVRVYYPRASSLQYLPAVYQQDEPSRKFLDQFLSIFDTLWAGIGYRLTNIAALFDPMATPATAKNPADTDFLTWLASWVGLTLDRHWPEERRRNLLKNAWKLYNLRGTPEGLRLHVQLYTGIEPQVLEHFKLRRWLYAGSARLGDQSALWGAEVVDRLELNVHSQLDTVRLIDTGNPLTDPFARDAHQFTVFVPQAGAPLEPQSEALREQTIQRIISMAKPAHTLGYLKMTRPRFRIGIQSFIGKDTVVGIYPVRIVEGQSKLGYDSALSQSAEEQGPPAMRAGTARIGSTTLIN